VSLAKRVAELIGYVPSLPGSQPSSAEQVSAPSESASKRLRSDTSGSAFSAASAGASLPGVGQSVAATLSSSQSHQLALVSSPLVHVDRTLPSQTPHDLSLTPSQSSTKSQESVAGENGSQPVRTSSTTEEGFIEQVLRRRALAKAESSSSASRSRAPLGTPLVASLPAPTPMDIAEQATASAAERSDSVPATARNAAPSLLPPPAPRPDAIPLAVALSGYRNPVEYLKVTLGGISL
jgi:hypothetical protein